jgi:uncharacterized iron-regulated membrane protein
VRVTIPKRFSAAMLGAHALLGVVFAWALYLLCFSGSLAVLADEFAQWEQPGAPRVDVASPALVADVIERSYATTHATGKTISSLYVEAPSPTLPRITVYASGANEDDGSTLMADSAGHIVPESKTPWTDFMRGQHHDFNLPDPYGDYLVGILGTILIAGLVSGLLAHRRIIKDAFRLRWGGSHRRSNADLHNRIGVWALPFHLVVSLTGSLLGLGGLIIGVLALIAFKGDQQKAAGALLGPQPTADVRPAKLPDVRPMFGTIEVRAPGSAIASVMIAKPGTHGQVVTVYTAAPGHLTRAEGWSFTGEGRLISKAGFTDGTVGMRIYGMITPLHYGTYGGLALKLIYVILGGSLTTLVASGLTVWLGRRREQGHAAPRRERLWVALVWGQPLAFALSSLLSLTAGLDPMRVFWLTTAGVAALALVSSNAASTARWARMAGGAVLIALAVSHLLLLGRELLVDLVLVVIALALVTPMLRTQRWRYRTPPTRLSTDE